VSKGKQCKYYEICGLPAEQITGGPDGYCILHSPNPNKNKNTFRGVFNHHYKNVGLNFQHFVFPIELDYSSIGLEGTQFIEQVSFKDVVFLNKVSFNNCRFLEGVSFMNAKFQEEALFHGAKFNNKGEFTSVVFEDYCDFGEAEFQCEAGFLLSKFFKRVEFFGTVFQNSAEFRDSIFYDGARFLETKFNGEDALFSFSSFLAPTYFSSGRDSDPIFEGCELFFEEVTINPSNVLAFKNADFNKAILRGTDMRNVELSGIQWANFKERIAVYDEIKLERDDEEIIRYDTLEELYRNLKQNYTDRRDFLKAGYFHYGEKETIRKNPRTSNSVKSLLFLYRLISGYGERILPASISIIVLFCASVALYMYGGIIQTPAQVDNIGETATTIDYLIYGVETMFFMDSGRYQAASHISYITSIIQKVVSPILLALLALAIRQRLKR